MNREREAQAVGALERIAAAAEEPPRRERRRELDAAFPALERRFAGERGAVLLLLSIPGFAGLWTRRVPDSHLFETRDRQGHAWMLVCCVCGAHLALDRGWLSRCACGRWFLHAGRTVRVWREPADAEPLDAVA